MLRLLPFCILLLFSTTEAAFGQVTLKANGNTSLGTTDTWNLYRVRIASPVGSSNPTALYIETPISGASRFGIQVFADGGSAGNRAIHAVATGSGTAWSYGARGEAYDGLNAFGVYGKASGATNFNYAGYFNGDVAVLGNFINPSDAKLKERSQPLETISKRV